MTKNNKIRIATFIILILSLTFIYPDVVKPIFASESYVDYITPPQKKWDQLFGGDAGDYFNFTVATSDGGYVSVGYSTSSVSGEISDSYYGNYDAVIARFDANGELVWNHLFGGRGSDTFYSVHETSDGGFIALGDSISSMTGVVSSTNNGGRDGLVVKFDSDGNYLWDKLIGGRNDESFRSSLELSNGDILVAGYTGYGLTGSYPSTTYNRADGLVMKLTSNGDLVWNKVYGSKDDEMFLSIEPTKDGGFITSGYTYSSSSGDIIDLNNGGRDGLLVKFDSFGNAEWDQVFGGWEDDGFNSAIEVSGGGYIGVGYSNSRVNGEISDTNNGSIHSNDGLLVKFDENGNYLWDQLYGGTGNEDFKSIIEIEDGGFISSGYVGSYNNTGELTGYKSGTILMVKFDSNGKHVWDEAYGGYGYDVVNSLLKVDGGFIMTGYSNSASGDFLDLRNGDIDGLVAKFEHRVSSLEVTFSPWDRYVVSGDDVTFDSGVDGTPTPSVIWQKSSDDGVTWIDIPDATSSSLTFKADFKDNGNQYRAKYTNYYSSVYTNSAKLTVEEYRDYSGYYNIVSKNSGLVMDVYDAGKTEGTNIIQWGYHGMENQQWRFESLGEGYYKITSVLNPDYSLDVYGGGTEIGNKVIQYHYHGGINQQWKVLENEDGSISLMSRLSEENGTNFVLDVYGGGKTEGVNVIQYPSNGGDNQKWHLQPLVTHKLTFVTNGGPDMGYWVMNIGQRLPETVIPFKEGMVFAGWYLDSQLTIPWNIKSDRMPNYDITLYAKWVKDYNGTYVIRSKNSNLVMDVYGGGTTEGTNIIQYSYHGMTNQQWKFESLNNGYYKITSVLNPEYSIDVYGGGTTMGNRVIQYHYHGGINQQWKILENADGTISLMSRLAEESGTGYLLDVFGGGKTEGVNVIQWISNNGDNQKWYLDKVN